MFEKLEQLEAKYEEITRLLSDPEILADAARYQKHAKTHSDLSAVVEKFREYKGIRMAIADTKKMIQDGGLEEELKDRSEERRGGKGGRAGWGAEVPRR